MGKRNKPCAWRKAIFSLYIWVQGKYIKPGVDTFWCFLCFIGDILLFLGVVLLVVDFVLLEPNLFCLPCRIHTGWGLFGDLSTFMANYQCSHMNQAWFTCLYLGCGFNGLAIFVGKL